MGKLDMLLEMELGSPRRRRATGATVWDTSATRPQGGVGITGGEEDGVDNEDANPEDLYSKPEEIWQVCAEATPAAGVSRRRAPDPLTPSLRVWQVYEKLSAVPNGRFTVAAAFGNVHGVYAPGNAELDPVETRGRDLDETGE